MSNCSSGCPTPGAHQSYGECLRLKATRVAYCNSVAGSDYTREKKWNRELDRSRDLMSKGILPENTFGPALDRAERASDATGTPFRADELP